MRELGRRCRACWRRLAPDAGHVRQPRRLRLFGGAGALAQPRARDDVHVGRRLEDHDLVVVAVQESMGRRVARLATRGVPPCCSVRSRDVIHEIAQSPRRVRASCTSGRMPAASRAVSARTPGPRRPPPPPPGPAGRRPWRRRPARCLGCGRRPRRAAGTCMARGWPGELGRSHRVDVAGGRLPARRCRPGRTLARRRRRAATAAAPAPACSRFVENDFDLVEDDPVASRSKRCNPDD